MTNVRPGLNESAVEAGSLRGTLCRAEGAQMADLALIVPGSGPTDRDGNSPLGIRAAPYRLLAAALAERGIASLRIDKRGLFGSGGSQIDVNVVTIEDYVQDLQTWLVTLRERFPSARLWLIGHSEGGLIATLAALADSNVSGLVLAAAPGRRLGDILREQLAANPANERLLDEANFAIKALERGGRVEVTTLALQPLFRSAVQGFLISAFSYDPAELLARFRGPALLLQGEADLQVGLADLERLSRAQPYARVVRLPGVNHVLKQAPTEREANLASYGDPTLPLAPGIVDAVAEFIHDQHSGARGAGSRSV
jgi:pimeloyl-ACP methyl ester carboxylesterase